MMIDENLLEAASSWLVSSQLSSGKFIETSMFPDDNKVPVEFKVVIYNSKAIFFLELIVFILHT